MTNLLSIMRVRTLQAVISAVLIVQLLNFSINSTDHSHKADSPTNEIESFLELWVEIVLGNGNIFQDTEEGDENKGKRDKVSIFLFTADGDERLSTTANPEMQYIGHVADHFESRKKTIITPPPRSLRR